MKDSNEFFGIKNFYLQDISTRSLKENIDKTFKKIVRIKKEHKIDTIFCPAYEGGHQDHDVANFICSRLKKNCMRFMSLQNIIILKKKINNNYFFCSNEKQKVIFLTSLEKEKEKLLKYINLNQKILTIYHLKKNRTESFLIMIILLLRTSEFYFTEGFLSLVGIQRLILIILI